MGLEIEKWEEYMKNTIGLPMDQLLKAIRCVMGGMVQANKKGAIELVAKWTYEYLQIVVKEKHLSTIQDVINLSREENRIKILPIHILLVLWDESLKHTFRDYVKRKGIKPTLNNFLKYVSMHAAKVFIDDKYYDIKSIGIVACEAWEDFFVMKMYNFITDIITDEHNREIMNVINQIIDKRRTYGLHTERVPSGDFCILAWSNGWEMWYIAWMIMEYVKKHRLREVELDANEIIVPYSCKTVAKVICFLRPLPLYAYSFEYKRRYVPPTLWKKHSADWAKRVLLSRITKLLGG